MKKSDVLDIINFSLLIFNGFCAIWYTIADGRYDMGTFHLVFMLIFTVIIMLSRVSADVKEMLDRIDAEKEDEEKEEDNNEDE